MIKDVKIEGMDAFKEALVAMKEGIGEAIPEPSAADAGSVLMVQVDQTGVHPGWQELPTVNPLVDYSTVPKQIGTWIDGETPVYRVVFPIDATLYTGNGGGNFDYTDSQYNDKTIISAQGIYDNGSNYGVMNFTYASFQSNHFFDLKWGGNDSFSQVTLKWVIVDYVDLTSE